MRKTEHAGALLPDYGKQKLLTYADSFRDLANTFLLLPEENNNMPDEIDRQDFLMQKRLMENRGLLADHLNEMAQIMTRVAEESFSFFQPAEKQMRQLNTILKEKGIYVKDIYMIENKNKRLELSVNLQAVKNTTFSVEEVAGVFSVVFNKRLIPAIGSLSYLQKEMQTVLFEEESRFGVLTGVARAVKEKEKVSGDNYSFLQIKNGNLTASLSDGMGTGEKACQDSAAVLDLLEKHLEAGFSKETAVQIINGVLIAGSEQQNMSTLDICEVDLYTGICEFIKIGSAVTFLKRAGTVEKINSESLPLGVFSQIDVETVKKQVADGDYIILVSDGIVDALPIDGGEDVFREMLAKITIQNPKEIANQMLNFALRAGKGSINDDMTVLVIGIWENIVSSCNSD